MPNDQSMYLDCGLGEKRNLKNLLKFELEKFWLIFKPIFELNVNMGLMFAPEALVGGVGSDAPHKCTAANRPPGTALALAGNTAGDGQRASCP